MVLGPPQTGLQVLAVEAARQEILRGHTWLPCVRELQELERVGGISRHSSCGDIQ